MLYFFSIAYSSKKYSPKKVTTIPNNTPHANCTPTHIQRKKHTVVIPKPNPIQIFSISFTPYTFVVDHRSVNGDHHAFEVNIEFDPSVPIRKGSEVIEGFDVDVVAFAVVANEECHVSSSFLSLTLTL